MTCTLSFIEVIRAKKATEKAITKLLTDLQRETGIEVKKLYIDKLIGSGELIAKIETAFSGN